MHLIFVLYIAIVSSLCGGVYGDLIADAEFYNPPPPADPVPLKRLQFVSRVADIEIYRISQAILDQNLDTTHIIFYGEDITVQKESCLDPTVTPPCFMASLDHAHPEVNVADTTMHGDPVAFQKLAVKAINMGIIRPNRVKGPKAI
jgi:hypothetical protein